MKRALAWLIITLAVGGGIWFGFLRRPAPQRDALHVREIAARGLAEFLAGHHPGARALILSNPFTQQSSLPREMRDMEEAGVRGVKSGLGAKARPIVVFPELKAGALENPRGVYIDAESTTPLSYLVAEDAFDKLADQHRDCGIVVSLIGLPVNLGRVRCWQDKDGPKFALLLPDLRIIGNRAAVRRAFESGKLLAFVAAKPGAAIDQKSSGDFNAEFERQFVLVTRDKLESTLRMFPQLFPPN